MLSLGVSSIPSAVAVPSPILSPVLPRGVIFQYLDTLTVGCVYPDGMEDRARLMFDKHVEPHLKPSRYKKHKDFPEFVRLFNTGCLAALCWRSIRYSRRNDSVLNRVISAAVKAKLFREERGKPGGPHQSRLLPIAGVFLDLAGSDPWKLYPPIDMSFVQLRERHSKRLREISPAEKNIACIQEQLILVNKVNAQHVITAERVCVSYSKTGRHKFARPDVTEHQLGIQQLRSLHVAVFTENPENEGMLEWQGRCYTNSLFGHQQLRKRERPSIRFDGRPSVELDFSGMHPRLLYHLDRLKYPGDPYQLWGPSTTTGQRVVAKKLLNAAINADSKPKALRACLQDALSKDKKGNEKTGNALCAAINLETAMREAGVWRHTIPATLRSLERLYDDIEKQHAPIAEYLKSDSGVRRLMPIDGMIARDVMYHFAEQGKPILGVHDSFVVPAEDEAELRWAMYRYYSKHVNGFEPVVK